MSHLTSEQLVDLAEGTQSESSATHLQTCDRCRQELSEIRSTISMVSAAKAPGPSPLVWESLAARVRDAVDRERAYETTFAGRIASLVAAGVASFTKLPVQIAAAAVVVMSIALVVQRDRPAVQVTPLETAGPQVADLSTLSTDDASLSLVADLAAGLDWEAAAEAGFTIQAGVDDLVSHLSDAEMRELRQLLQGELSPSRRGA